MMFSIIDDMDKRERDYSIDFVKGVAILFDSQLVYDDLDDFLLNF